MVAFTRVASVVEPVVLARPRLRHLRLRRGTDGPPTFGRGLLCVHRVWRGDSGIGIERGCPWAGAPLPVGPRGRGSTARGVPPPRKPTSGLARALGPLRWREWGRAEVEDHNSSRIRGRHGAQARTGCRGPSASQALNGEPNVIHFHSRRGAFARARRRQVLSHRLRQMPPHPSSLSTRLRLRLRKCRPAAVRLRVWLHFASCRRGCIPSRLWLSGCDPASALGCSSA
mmetsp:Transcript_3507/g.8782  ORF Transcript_3507/g.8782 Transcript_3507/m.8782 type:complete len:228 (-) Transcript_3507:317-1000(-)